MLYYIKYIAYICIVIRLITNKEYATLKFQNHAKIEFEERTRLKLTEDGYKEVEECYMNTDLDKDTFCELWVKNPTALKEIERKTVLVRELYEERKCLSNFLIDQAEKWSASDLREKAITMIGEREYLRRKLAKGYNLWKLDKELLDEILR